MEVMTMRMWKQGVYLITCVHQSISFIRNTARSDWRFLPGSVRPSAQHVLVLIPDKIHSWVSSRVFSSMPPTIYLKFSANLWHLSWQLMLFQRLARARVCLQYLLKERSWKCECSYLKDWTDNGINKISLIYSYTHAKYTCILCALYLCCYDFFIRGMAAKCCNIWDVPGLIDLFILLESPLFWLSISKVTC